MILLTERKLIIQWVDEASRAGARVRKACAILGISLRSLQRWRESGAVTVDGRTTRLFIPANKLTEVEREQLLQTVQSKKLVISPMLQLFYSLARVVS